MQLRAKRNFSRNDYCEPGLRPVTTSISETDGKVAATGSSFAAGVVAGGGLAAAVAEMGGSGEADAGGGADGGAGNAALVEGAGGVALGAGGGGGFLDSLSRSTSDCDGKASVAYSTEEEDEQAASNGSAPATTRTERPHLVSGRFSAPARSRSRPL